MRAGKLFAKGQVRVFYSRKNACKLITLSTDKIIR